MAKDKNRIVPRRGETTLLAEAQTHQARLRKAVSDAVQDVDVKEVVEGIVKRAKEGDKAAIEQLFKHVLSGGVTTLVQNNYYIDEDPGKPTKKRPGTNGKIDMLAARAASGGPLFDDQDAGHNDE